MGRGLPVSPQPKSSAGNCPPQWPQDIVISSQAIFCISDYQSLAVQSLVIFLPSSSALIAEMVFAKRSFCTSPPPALFLSESIHVRNVNAGDPFVSNSPLTMSVASLMILSLFVSWCLLISAARIGDESILEILQIPIIAFMLSWYKRQACRLSRLAPSFEPHCSTR